MNDSTAGRFHAFLVERFPTMVDAPFSDNPTINVQRMADATGFSNQAVYNWISRDRIGRSGVRRLIEIARQPKNLDALKRLGRTPPTVEDFAQFAL